MRFVVIGIADNKEQFFAPNVLEEISKAKVFSGGKRHHELVCHLLPEGYEWIDVTVPLSKTFEAYKASLIVVFASGDPLFYGYATTLKREFPDAELTVYPSFSSLQMLAHRMLLPYQDLKMVSQTGRPWEPLDEALIRGERMIGVLTDKYKTPRAIADRMLEYGYDNYRVTIGECLGNPQEERVREFALSDVPEDVRQPNCMILLATEVRSRYFGIPEAEFHLLDGRAKMITKAPIRLMSLSAMGLQNRSCMWDVGFCTGSVSIEARLQFPHLHIESFEIRPEGERLMALNARKFGAPGIAVHIGDFLDMELDSLPRPDAVFIGGHGGKLCEIVQRISRYLLPGGVIVFNSVSEESREMFLQSAHVVSETRVALDEHNMIDIMTATNK